MVSCGVGDNLLWFVVTADSFHDVLCNVEILISASFSLQDQNYTLSWEIHMTIEPFLEGLQFPFWECICFFIFKLALTNCCPLSFTVYFGRFTSLYRTVIVAVALTRLLLSPRVSVVIRLQLSSSVQPPAFSHLLPHSSVCHPAQSHTSAALPEVEVDQDRHHSANNGSFYIGELCD